jgi:hypothetical protein
MQVLIKTISFSNSSITFNLVVVPFMLCMDATTVTLKLQTPQINMEGSAVSVPSVSVSEQYQCCPFQYPRSISAVRFSIRAVSVLSVSVSAQYQCCPFQYQRNISAVRFSIRAVSVLSVSVSAQYQCCPFQYPRSISAVRFSISAVSVLSVSVSAQYQCCPYFCQELDACCVYERLFRTSSVVSSILGR